MRIQEITDQSLMAQVAQLFQPEPQATDTRKSTWVADVTFMSRGGIGHLLIIKHDGAGLLYVGEQIKPWMKGLILAGIWSAKEQKLSRGYAVNKLLRAKGYVYQAVKASDMDSVRVVLNRGINLAREERKASKRSAARQARLRMKLQRARKQGVKVSLADQMLSLLSREVRAKVLAEVNK